jgi:hypothetical protein
MAEPSTTAIAAGTVAAGLTVFGVSTGLDPATLVAGFAGGAWAQSYHPPATWWKRVSLTLMSAVISGYLSPVAAAAIMYFSKDRGGLPLAVLQLPTAVLVGLTAHRVLGPAVMRFAAKKAEDLTK